MVEESSAFSDQRGQKLDDEERVAAGLLVHQLRERRGARRRRSAARRAISCADDRRGASGAEAISCTCRRACRIASSVRMQRMRGVDLVVAVGADQQQVLHVGLGQQLLDQIERGRVEPLQIVEEQRERMLRPREHADEAPEHQLEAALRLLRRQLRDRRLLADDELHFGDQVDDRAARSAPAPRGSASRHRASSASLLPSSGRIRLWKACASVA